MKNKISKILIIFSTSLISVSTCIADTYTFGVVPQQSAKKLAKLWSPILKYVSEKSNHTIKFKTAKDIPAFEKSLANREYDLAYMNPYHYTVFHDLSGYDAFAKRKDQDIKGILVVRKDSNIESINELNGSEIAFPSPGAFAASILIRSKLNKDNIKYSPKYVSSHDSVYLNVEKGLTKAGGGVKRTLNNTKVETKEQLKVLWETKGYTPHAFAVKSDIDDSVKSDIISAFLDLSNTEEGKELLQSIKIKNGLVKANDSDWNDVRELNINELEDLKKK